MAKTKTRQVTNIRRIVQAVFGFGLIGTSIAHNLIAEQTGAAIASAEALCPFGGLETLYRYFTSGLTLSKIHLSNLVMLAALMTGLLLAGNAFCGWVCPFGALQDLLDWVRRKLHLPTVTVPDKLDRILRYGRFRAGLDCVHDRQFGQVVVCRLRSLPYYLWTGLDL